MGWSGLFRGHFFDEGFETFDFFASNVCEELTNFLAIDGYIGIAGVDVDATDVGGLEMSFLTEETEDVATTDLVFLAFADVEGDHPRRNGAGWRGRECERLEAFGGVWGGALVGREDEIAAARLVPAGGATDTMRVGVFGFG